MIVLQTIAVAFAMFSAIPVPQFEWNEKNMRYAMCAFPLIGVVIGAAWCVCGALPLPGLAKAAGFALIPVWITGGIHLDGYADTCDALSSYGDREKKLEILKDPHCGAFAVIRLEHGLDAKGTDMMIRQWLHRNYIRRAYQYTGKRDSSSRFSNS